MRCLYFIFSLFIKEKVIQHPNFNLQHSSYKAASPHIKIHIHNCQVHLKIAAVAGVTAAAAAACARVLNNRNGMPDSTSLHKMMGTEF